MTYFGLIAVLLLGVSKTAFAEAPRCEGLDFIANYKVTFNNWDAGTSHRKFQIRGNCSHVRFDHQIVVKPIYAALGVHSVRQVSNMAINSQAEITPINFTYESGDEFYEATFDFENRTLNVSNGKQYEIPKVDEVLDWESWFISFLLRNSLQISDLAGQSVAIADHDSVNVYTYDQPTLELVETSDNSYETIRITMRRVDKKERTMTIWIAPSMENMPIKLQDKKKNQTITLDFLSVDQAQST